MLKDQLYTNINTDSESLVQAYTTQCAAIFVIPMTPVMCYIWTERGAELQEKYRHIQYSKNTNKFYHLLISCMSYQEQLIILKIKC